MAAPDLEVIKDIPGYKVILKAVLKSQIQHLVEQLAATTDEESVILTASVADGTLSHLGSESAKGFLEDHEDIKSQFLGFCLKTHHRQKQEKQRLEAEAALKQARRAVERHPSSLRGPYPARGPRFSSPPGSGPVHPVAIARASRTSVRSPGSRHEPYPTTRSSRRTSTEPSPVELQDNPGQPIKLEENVERNQGESDTVTAVEQGSSNESPSSDADAKDDDASSESATSAKLNEPLSDADLSNMTSGSHQETGGELDSSVTVKMEEFTESDMDLEITGVQPGSSVSQDNWDPNLSMGMNFDPTSVIGSQDDMGAQGYNPGSIFSEDGYIMNPDVCSDTRNRSITDQSDCRVVQTDQSIYRETQPFVKYNQDGLNMFICQYENCCKAFATKHMILRHLRSHTKEKPFVCGYCEFRCSRKDNLQQHITCKHKDMPKNSV